jgi:Fe-S oxidoreductase
MGENKSHKLLRFRKIKISNRDYFIFFAKAIFFFFYQTIIKVLTTNECEVFIFKIQGCCGKSPENQAEEK